MTKARELRVAFHALDDVGLGHLVRAASLAAEMRTLAPGVRLLVLTNAADVSVLVRAGLDWVRLPARLTAPHADPERATTALPDVLEETALVAALEAFAPDLVVFDTHAPTHVVKRLPALGARAVLLLRELDPEALRAFVASEAPLELDRIVVLHEPTEVDLELLAGSPVSLVGPVVRRLRASPENASSKHERRGPLVVALACGGGPSVDPRRYARAVADAHLLARVRLPSLETVIVVGPDGMFPPDADGIPGLTVARCPPDVDALLAEATLVVSPALYDALAQIRALEKPVVLVSGRGETEDQRARARKLARVGAAVTARPEARAIADRIEAILGSPSTLASMRAAHRAYPLRPQNRAAAEAALRPLWIPRGSAVSRVAIVAHDYAPKLGSAATVARTLADGLRARGVAARVYTTNRLGARSAGDAGAIAPIYQPLPPPLGIDLFRDLLATIDEALRDAPDVIHLCHAGLGPWVPALRAALPCVVTVSVHGNDLLAPSVHHQIAPEAYREAQIAGLSRADAVFCVSRFSGELARAHGVVPDNVHTIENGIDPARFAPGTKDGAALARRLGLDPDDEIVLTVSRLVPHKGHETVLYAIARLAERRPKLKYVFTGRDEAMISELSRLAGELGIASRLVPAGFVADAELPALYGLARAFVLLAGGGSDSDVEGFGVALLEAAASGLPVIASRTGGIPEVVADGESGILVTPGDPAAAAEAIERVLADPELARSMGERGRERVIERFSQDHATERVLAIWSTLLGRGPRRPDGAHTPPLAWLGRTEADGAHTPELHAALAAARGVELVRLARRYAEDRRRARARRREALRSSIERGEVVRLRASGDDARLFADALDDCSALGHAPLVEVDLRRFLDADFQEHALPQVSAFEIVHAVPHMTDGASTGRCAGAILAMLRALPNEALALVRSVRLLLAPEAREAPSLVDRAAGEAHALRSFFLERGTRVLLARELTRLLTGEGRAESAIPNRPSRAPSPARRGRPTPGRSRSSRR